MSDKHIEQNALMSCPFCGDENATFVIKGDKRYVRCGNKRCGAVIEAPAGESAVKNWNRREPPKWTKIEFIDTKNDAGEPVRIYTCDIPANGQKILMHETEAPTEWNVIFDINSEECKAWDWIKAGVDAWWSPFPVMKEDA